MSGPPGKIVTFYSYKGGTGRSMALANVAWILASNGLRVLAIDWDLEAPGLHRYLHPFLDDPELASSSGIVDYLADVTVAARHAATAARTEPGSTTGGEPWWRAWTNLRRYSHSIDWEFPGVGTIDLVPAGRQGMGYAERVSSFSWTDFYEKLGGGVLLEALKRELRRDYDYVLIDSRTGVSDTAGICTVQMPDDLVVCFTLNQQSTKGAAAVADSAWTQRLKPTGEPGLRIWPVPTRIEHAEKEKLEAAMAAAYTTFQRYLMHLPRAARTRYWERVQVLYQPFFAYEEILAPFVEDRSRSSGTMVASMEALAAAISDTVDLRLQPVSARRRFEVMARYARPSKSRSTGHREVFVSFAPGDAEQVTQVTDRLKQAGFTTRSEADFRLGAPRLEESDRLLASSLAMLHFAGHGKPAASSLDPLEFELLRRKPVIPVLIGDTGSKPELPAILRMYVAADLRGSQFTEGLSRLVRTLEQIARTQPGEVDPDDPEKGQWGDSVAPGRELSAVVTEIANDWYSIDLQVREVPSTVVIPALKGEVVFHLHPSFPEATQRVPVVDGRAAIRVFGWGAFTVGAEADGGQTRLELDLAADPSFPAPFRAR